MSAVAGTIIDSVKAEIKFMEVTGEQVDTEFFGEIQGLPRPPRMLRC